LVLIAAVLLIASAAPQPESCFCRNREGSQRAKNGILSAVMLMGYEQHCADLPPSVRNILSKLLDTLSVDDRILVKQVADHTNQVPTFCAYAEELVKETMAAQTR
jgi:hypothetical protein